MKILVVGDGMLGMAIAEAARLRSHIVFQTSRKRGSEYYLDMRDLSAVRALPDCDWVVGAAAISGYRQCEESIDAYKVNVVNTIDLADEMMSRGAKFFFPSSTAVFNGDTPFVSPEHNVSPITTYGKQKVEVESYLKKQQERSVIVRFSKLLGAYTGLLSKWLEDINCCREIKAFTDLTLAPVLLEDAGCASVRLMEEGAGGLFHCSGPEEISYYDFATLLCKAMNRESTLVKAVSCRDIKELYFSNHSSLDAKSLEDAIGYVFPPVKELISKVLSI
ncbi:SDR family oxidoreductase [Maridesulfovibrio sp. FT414]|uniref:SDR family oxidoreductase n=1 Tax=Maridesulfovibrio sp. FT414 TaxID=2979469 RepID=UPI003D80574F